MLNKDIESFTKKIKEDCKHLDLIYEKLEKYHDTSYPLPLDETGLKEFLKHYKKYIEILKSITEIDADIKKIEDKVIALQTIMDLMKKWEFGKFGDTANMYIKEIFQIDYFFEAIKKIEGINIRKLESSIIERKDPSNINRFAKEVKGANIKKLEKAIIASKDNFYIESFAKEIKGASIRKLENAIIASKDNFYIESFAKEIKGASIRKLENAIIASKYGLHIRSFAKEVKGANIQKLEDAIITSFQKPEEAVISLNDKSREKYIVPPAIMVKKEDIKELEEILIASKNNTHGIVNFASIFNKKGANIKKLQNAVMASKNMSEILRFAEKVKGADIEKIEYYVLRNGKSKDIEYFIQGIRQRNKKINTDYLYIEMLEKRVKEQEKKIKIYKFILFTPIVIAFLILIH